jgi:ATP-dependent Clp protease ATP-binding subunit ClpC
MKESVMKEVREIFRPEFINRVDELIVFHSLNEDEIRRITELMLKQVADRLKEQEIPLTWDKKVTEKLAKEGYDPKFGARPLRRLIQRTVEDTMSEELLKGNIQLGQEIRLTVKGGEIVPVTRKKAEKPAAEKPAAKKPAAKKPAAKKPAAKQPEKKAEAKKEEKPVG